ncbi:MAG: DUF2783 domain-containing protein [Acetobacteraceae bacterium]
MSAREPGILVTEPNIASPDDFYELLIESHRDLSLEQSQLLNAKLILLLANQLGDLAVLREALAKARGGLGPSDRTRNQPQRKEH